MMGRSESLPMVIPTSGAGLTTPPAAPRPRAPSRALRRGVAQRGDVAELAPVPGRLAVQVHVRTGHGQRVRQRRRRDRVAATDDVDRRDRRRAQLRRAERPVEHRAQVLLELRGLGALDRPVPGVVRAQGELVDDDRPFVG
jgi:hypothetical protein